MKDENNNNNNDRDKSKDSQTEEILTKDVEMTELENEISTGEETKQSDELKDSTEFQQSKESMVEPKEDENNNIVSFKTFFFSVFNSVLLLLSIC